MVRVVSVPHSMIDVRHVRNEVPAAGGSRGMRVHDGLPAVQLLHDGGERRIAEPLVAVAREQGDTVGLERVERVRDLVQRALDVGHRHGGEHAETALGIRGQLRRVVIALARQLPGARVVQEAHGRRRDGRQGRRHAGLVHVGQRLLRRPVAHRARNVPGGKRGDVRRRRVVVVYVDPVRLDCRHLGLRLVSAEERARSEGGHPGQKLASCGTVDSLDHLSPPRAGL